jgi:transcriptional regulator with XRE-family HTH domain
MGCTKYLAHNIVSLRTYYRFSQRDVAEAGGVTRNFMSAVENGEKYPSIKTIMGIADLFGVTIDEMINTPPNELLAEVDRRERET